MGEYEEFIANKSQYHTDSGFDPIWMPDGLFDFQIAMTEWAIRKGRAALFENCGMGKTRQQLVFAENVVRKTNKPVLLATPLAVGMQTVAEAEAIGVTATKTKDGIVPSSPQVVVTNYEQIHKYDPSLFAGFVGDESSAIKDFKSKRKSVVVDFARKLRYRLLCTATAAPNDHFELGTSSEALGYLGFRDMITTFFKQETSKDHKGWGRTKYRFRGHAEQPFWSWVCSWARSLQKPSDLGFDDSQFILPELIESDIVVEVEKAIGGKLFSMPAGDMREERAERRHSLQERCERAAEIANNHSGSSSIWCELNPEGDLLEKLIKDCVQVYGSMSDDEKEEALIAFSNGQIKNIITKPKIGAWGMNWQHCHNVVCFPTHSFEQYYQLVRRHYRFGQKNPVTVHRIISEGEQRILENLKRKAIQADRMFASIVEHMRDAMAIVKRDFFPEREEIPTWL